MRKNCGRPGFVLLAILVGLFCCSAASANLMQGIGPAPGLDAGFDSVDPLAGIPEGGYSNPDALALANYWFSIMSDPWNNYSLILELFGPQGAAALLAAEAPSPLLNPHADPGTVPFDPAFTVVFDPAFVDTLPLATGAAQGTPEPVSTLLCATGLLALAGWGLASSRRRTVA